MERYPSAGDATHRQTFANNLMTNLHTDNRQTHDMVWVCDEHGPEVVDSQGEVSVDEAVQRG